MRTFVSLEAVCTLDLDQVQEAFDQRVVFDDTDPVSSSVQQSGVVVLAPSTSSQQFAFGSVTAASTVLVLAYDPVKVQLNGNTAPLVDLIPVPASSATAVTSRYQRQAQPGPLLLRGKVTSIHLSNPSSTASARVFVGIVGNAP